MADKPRVSIVIPAYNEAPCLVKLHQELMDACDLLPFQFEFLIVNDGSTDETEQVLADLRRRDDRVRYLALSRNFGHQGALSAGMAFATGDAVITMDADLQHPPSMIPRLLECWDAGYDVVNTVRLDTADSSLSKRLLSRAFYCVFKTLTGVHIEPGSADFRLISHVSRSMPSTGCPSVIASSAASFRGWDSGRPACHSVHPRDGPAIPSTHSAAVCVWRSKV